MPSANICQRPSASAMALTWQACSTKPSPLVSTTCRLQLNKLAWPWANSAERLRGSPCKRGWAIQCSVSSGSVNRAGSRMMREPSQPTPSSGLMTKGSFGGSSACLSCAGETPALQRLNGKLGTTGRPCRASLLAVASLLAARRTAAAGLVSSGLPALSTSRQSCSRMPAVSGAMGQTASQRPSASRQMG